MLYKIDIENDRNRITNYTLKDSFIEHRLKARWLKRNAYVGEGEEAGRSGIVFASLAFLSIFSAMIIRAFVSSEYFP